MINYFVKINYKKGTLNKGYKYIFIHFFNNWLKKNKIMVIHEEILIH